MVQLKESAPVDHGNTSITSVAPPSPSSCTVSDTEVIDAACNSTELSGAVPLSLHCLVTASASLDVETFRTSRSNNSSPAPVAIAVAEECPIKLLTSSESSTDISQRSEEISVNHSSLMDSRKWTNVSLPYCRSASSSCLTEMSKSKHSKTGLAASLSRKRKHEYEIPECGRLTFDKLPNYYTALSIPTRVMAGSAARSSSDLVKDFMHNERDPSPERKSCSVYDKLPAYYSSFTNSTRYDDDEQTSMPAFETDFCRDELEAEVRYGRSSSENYELHDFTLADESLVEGSCADDDHEREEETSTENVSCILSLLSYIAFTHRC